MTVWESLENLPRWLILGLIVIAMIIPIMRPLGLPIVTSEETRDFYDVIEGIPAGGVLLFDIGYGSGGYPSLGPGNIALFHQAFSRPIKVVIIATALEGSMMYPLVMKGVQDTLTEYGKVYGTDYCFLGYIAGEQTAMAAVLGDLHAAFTADFYGTPIAQISMLADIRDYNDIDVVAYITTAGGISEGWVYQSFSRYNRVTVGGWLSMMTAAMKPYYTAGSLAGYMDGIKGAADYEYFTGHPGDALLSTDVLSLTQTLVLIYIIIGNIAYFGRRAAEGGS